MEKNPGWDVWSKGGTRAEMQFANREAGRACYCASLWNGFCDFCSGMAKEGSQRWNDMIATQANEQDWPPGELGAGRCEECGEPVPCSGLSIEKAED